MIDKYLACGWISLSRSSTATPSPYSSTNLCLRGHRKTCTLQMSSSVMSIYPSDRVVTQLPVNMHCKNVTCPVIVSFTHLHQKTHINIVMYSRTCPRTSHSRCSSRLTIKYTTRYCYNFFPLPCLLPRLDSMTSLLLLCPVLHSDQSIFTCLP